MLNEKIKIRNSSGLHLESARLLCEAAMKFQSTITFMHGGNIANTKSILSVLGACVKCGDEIELEFDGEDEAEAREFIIQIIKDGLGDSD